MGAIFISQPGRVVAIPLVGEAPLPFAMTGWNGPSLRAIVTEVSLTNRENFTATASFGDVIYAFRFGRRMGQLRVGGIAFAGGCGIGGGGSGVDNVQRYYDEACASRRPAPVDVAIGESRCSAFLVGLDISVTKPEAGLSQFILQFETVPRKL